MQRAPLLQQEQESLLSAFVEAYRSVPGDQREPFHMETSDESYFAEIGHRGFPDRTIRAYENDINTLARKGFLDLSYSLIGVIYAFDITPEGFAYYRQIKQRDNEPVQRIENILRSYLEADRFQHKYSSAYQKWKDAEALLWDSDSERQLTTIGHLCREAVQQFASVLVGQYQPLAVEKDGAKTVARLKAVLDSCKSSLASTEQPFLKALLNYWGTVSDLIQRQEHGSHKEGHSLIWEDARRVVLQTAIVMLEVDSYLSRIANRT